MVNYNRDLGSPQKRRRTTEVKHTSTVRRISRLIHQSITNAQRAEAFFDAQKSFDHRSEGLHDIEVKEGVVPSLCLQLGYILNKGPPDGRDVANIFHVLSLVYECSDPVREKSFHQLGRDLLRMTYDAFDSVRYTEQSGWSSYHIMKVLRSLSRLRSASVAMVHQVDILKILQITILDRETNLGAKLEAIATLKNISFYAEDFRYVMLHHPGLLDSLIKSCTDHADDIGREFASAVVRNLAMAPDTKVPMAEHPCLLDALIELTDDGNPKTKRNAVSAIGSLAIEDENSMVFVTHEEGVILQIMQRLLEKDGDAVVRRRAARALRCFGRKDTVGMIVDRQGIVDALCRVATDDPTIEVQVEAVEALACYVSQAEAMSPYYGSIMDAMIKIAKSSPSSSCMETLAKTMNTLACYENHRKPMVNHRHLLETMTSLAIELSSTTLSREHTVSALHSLSCDEENREKMACSHVLITLVTIASDERGESSTAQLNAIRALNNLALSDTNKKCMANEKGLLRSLLQYATISLDPTLKDETKITIVQLIPSL